MSLASFEEVLSKIDGHGSYIYLHLKGEPLLHPDLDGVLTACDQHGVKVTITTNGTLLQDRRDILVKHSCIRQISISLQSYEGELGNDAWAHYFEGVLGVVNQLRVETQIITELRLWNYEDEASIEIDGHNNLVISLIEERLALDHPIYGQLKKGKGIKIADRVYLSQSYEFQWPDINLPIINDLGTCYGLRQQIGILVNGDVVPCCLDSEGDMVLGNIFETEFETIISSKRASEMVQGFENREIVEALCQRCGYRKRFDKQKDNY